MQFDLVAEARWEVEDVDATDFDMAATEAAILNDWLADAFPPSAAIRAELRYEKNGEWKVMRLNGKNH